MREGPSGPSSLSPALLGVRSAFGSGGVPAALRPGAGRARGDGCVLLLGERCRSEPDRSGGLGLEVDVPRLGGCDPRPGGELCLVEHPPVVRDLPGPSPPGGPRRSLQPPGCCRVRTPLRSGAGPLLATLAGSLRRTVLGGPSWPTQGQGPSGPSLLFSASSYAAPTPLGTLRVSSRTLVCLGY